MLIKKQLSARVDTETLWKIERLQDKFKYSKPQIIRKALEFYLAQFNFEKLVSQKENSRNGTVMPVSEFQKDTNLPTDRKN